MLSFMRDADKNVPQFRYRERKGQVRVTSGLWLLLWLGRSAQHLTSKRSCKFAVYPQSADMRRPLVQKAYKYHRYLKHSAALAKMKSSAGNLLYTTIACGEPSRFSEPKFFK